MNLFSGSELAYDGVMLEHWPPELLEFLQYPTEAETLSGGLSGCAVDRVQLEDRNVVVKANVAPREAGFYRDFAAVLKAHGIRTPKLEMITESGDETWLVIEAIPAPLPDKRWLADPQMLETLRKLHEFKFDHVPEFAFRPAWTPAMNAHALQFLPKHLEEKLEHFRVLAQPLLEPHNLISGDPNPMNWGVLENGEPVLFDWDRFGLGTPALDLAITVPGLGSSEEYAKVAAIYRGEADAQLAREIAISKVWVIVDILGHVQETLVHKQMQPFLESIPTWLEQL
jgi:aminoglycoside phosphotransferase (APT) family kinase protein